MNAEEYLNSLPVYSSRLNRPMECSICYGNLEEGESLKQLFCEHIFHNECIIGWFKREITCPTCRHPMPLLPKCEECRVPVCWTQENIQNAHKKVTSKNQHVSVVTDRVDGENRKDGKNKEDGENSENGKNKEDEENREDGKYSVFRTEDMIDEICDAIYRPTDRKPHDISCGKCQKSVAVLFYMPMYKSWFIMWFLEKSIICVPNDMQKVLNAEEFPALINNIRFLPQPEEHI